MIKATLPLALQAVAGKIRTLFPGAEVLPDEIEQDVSGAFYLSTAAASASPRLSGTLYRNTTFDVKYFLTNGDNLAFAQWQDMMLENFHTVTLRDGAEEQILHCRNIETRRDDSRYYELIFDISVLFTDIPDGEKMETFDLKERLKAYGEK